MPEFDHEIDDVKFKLRPLSEVELEQVNYLLIDMIKGGHQVLPPSVVSYILDKCLKDWNGIEDEEGNYHPYRAGDEQYLQFKVRMELASVVYTSSVITEDEKKS